MYLSAAVPLKNNTWPKKHVAVLLTILIVFYLINGIVYLRYQTQTSDEASFYNYAVRLLKGHPDRIIPNSDNSKMPVTVLNTLPRIMEQVIHPHLKKMMAALVI